MSRKIITEKHPLSEEDFSKNNFSQVTQGASALAKTILIKKIILGVITATIIGGGIYFLKKNEKPTSEKQQEVTKPFILPPMAGAEIPDSVYTVDPAKGMTINYFSGSVITIPENAFVDGDGNIIKTPVKFSYREFHDPADFFVSGIPMTYDSAGTAWHFESAGMIEARAFSEGKEVFPNPNAEIRIDLASKQSGDHFNIYYLDTVKRKWDFVRRDTTKIIFPGPAPAPITETVESLIPVAIRDTTLRAFRLVFDEKDFPELAEFKNIVFQTRDKFAPEASKDTWDDMILEKAGNSSRYKLTLVRNETRLTLNVEPAIGEEEWNNYIKQAMSRPNPSTDLKAEYTRLMQERIAQQNAAASLTQGEIKEQLIFRSFTLRSFGVWNSDAPQALPEGKELFVKFMRPDSSLINLNQAYLVEGGKNAMFTYYKDYFPKFRYNKNAKNVVWAVTPDNKLAVADSETIAKAKTSGDTVIFIMKIHANKIKTSGDVRALIKI